MKFALGSNHDGNNTQTANELIADILDESVYVEEVGLYSLFRLARKLPCGRRAIDGDTRPHPTAMAEMQKLLNRLIAKHTHPGCYKDRAAPRHAYGAPEYVAYVVLNGGHA